MRGQLLAFSPLLSLILFVFTTRAQEPAEKPFIDGYVSQLSSQSSFSVDGRPVGWTPGDWRFCPDSQGSQMMNSFVTLGDHLLVYGKYDRKQRRIVATQLCIEVWHAQKVSGAAVVEAIEPDGSLRVDGRLLRLSSKTTTVYESPLQTAADAKPGDWARYTAISRRDGTFEAQQITLARNLVSDRESKIRAAKFVEFTPPDPAHSTAGVVKFVHLGKRFKLPGDAIVADRLARVGNSLIPAWQKSLQQDDPSRIDFRFYAIDRLKLNACLSTAGGTVFVPTKVVDRLSGDADLAAILATCVADLLEKQSVLVARDSKEFTGVMIGGFAAGFVVPGAGLAALAGTTIYGAQLAEHLRDQSARVSLDLLSAADYSPTVAPHAWELVQAKHIPPRLDAAPSSLTAYMYRALAERDRQATAGATE